MSLEISGMTRGVIPSHRKVLIDQENPLIKLFYLIDWTGLMSLFIQEIQKQPKAHLGRKLHLREHIGVYLLQTLYGLTDRSMELRLRGDLYFQIFCGCYCVTKFQIPDLTKIETFRNQFSSKFHAQVQHFILQNGVKQKLINPSSIDVDSTVQEANISYPTDVGLAVKMTSMIKRVISQGAKVLKGKAKKTLESVQLSSQEICKLSKNYFFLKKAQIEKKK